MTIEINALLDEATANSIGGEKPGQGIWNGFTREPFTDGSKCSPSSVPVQLRRTGLSMQNTPIGDRQDGSAEETGSASTDALAAVISFEVDSAADPYTYCWHTIIIGPNSQVIKESWWGHDFPLFFLC